MIRLTPTFLRPCASNPSGAAAPKKTRSISRCCTNERTARATLGVGSRILDRSRMTIVTSGSDDVVEQITKHLNRLIEVVKVVDLTEGAFIERELMLIKVRAVGKEREEMKRTTDIFRGRIIDVTDKTYTIELTGNKSKLDAFIDAIDRASILETVRTGGSGIGRGERILKV